MSAQKKQLQLTPLEQEVLKCWVSGVKSPKLISEMIKVKPVSVRVALHRLRKKGIIGKVEALTELETLIGLAKIALREGSIEKALVYLNQMERHVKVLSKAFEIINPRVIKWGGTRG